MVAAWFVQNPDTTVSPTTTPTFVGFPSINFISKCIKDFQDIHMTTIGGTMYLFSLSSPIYPLPLVCLTKRYYVDPYAMIYLQYTK